MDKLIGSLLLVLALGLAFAALSPEVGAASPHAVSVAAGSDCSFAVMDDGTVWAWGDNAGGQLGIGSLVEQEFPVQVPIDHVTAVDSMFKDTLALKDDGTVSAWGDNTWGQLGDGTFTASDTPVRVAGLDHVTAVAVGCGHCLALKDDGTVWAWGRGMDGQLGIGLISPMMPDGSRADNVSVTRPTQVNISNVVAIACGAFSSVALKDDGTVWEWGDRTPVPAQVPIGNVTGIACGYNRTLALKGDGTVWTWTGDSDVVQLDASGNLTLQSNKPSPVQVKRLGDVSAIAAGMRTMFAITEDGRVLAWGEDQYGVLGNGDYYGQDVVVPSPAVNMTGVKAVAAGDWHGLALKDDGTVWAWGYNEQGQAGTGNRDVKYYLPNGTIVVPKMLNPDGSVTGNVPAPEESNCIALPTQVQFGVPQQEINRTLLLPLPRQAPQVVPPGTPRPANVSLSREDGWSEATGAQVQYITNGGDGNIYAFAGNDILCIGADGTPQWNLTVPGEWTICESRPRIVSTFPGGSTTTSTRPQPVYTLSNGTLYLYAVPATAAQGQDCAVLAVSPDGRIEWNYVLDGAPGRYDDTFIGTSGGRVYVFEGNSETVLDANGTALFRIDSIAAPPAVDAEGNIYAADAAGNQTITAYGPDGSRRWQANVGDDIQWNYVTEDLRTEYGTTPVYQNGTLYVPTLGGVVALYTNGSVRWSRMMDYGTYQFFPLMPVDDYGNVYLESQAVDSTDFTSDVYVITDDGRNVSSPRKYAIGGPAAVARDGVIYDLSYDYYAEDDYGWPASLDNMTAYTVRAYDIVNDRVLWAYTIPADKIDYAVLNRDNIGSLLSSTALESWESGASHYQHPILADDQISLLIDGDTLYVIAREANYEVPVVLGQSRYAYVAGIYAIDTSGDIAYERPTSQIITAACVNNSTVFIATGSSGVSAVTVGTVAVAGLALLGAAAIAAKLFLFGTVARARSRLEQNPNRNRTLAYVRENPGSTFHEIARGTRMNMGTVRYHVFILGLNHRIVTFNDGKFVRYFPNSNTYSREEQQVIALLRRENTRQIIRSLLDSPWQTNAELSQRLGQPHSAINNYLKELSAKGITVKEDSADGRTVYSIAGRYIELIARLSQRLSFGEQDSVSPAETANA